MPEISVIVPTLKDREDIACLDHLERDDYGNYEVITSDENKATTARNKAIRHADADKLVFLDDDSHPCVGYLGLADELLDEHPIVAGRVIHPDDDMFKKLALNRGYDQGDEPGPAETIVGCNMLFRREVFETVGYFDEQIKWGHEETLLTQRAQREYPLFYHPDLVVTHRFGGSVLDWWRKQARWGPADVYAAKVNKQPVFSNWYELVPAIKGESFGEVAIKTVGKSIRNLSRLVAMFRGVPDPPDTSQVQPD